MNNVLLDQTPKTERDTASYKVFKWRFEVLIPSAYAMSEFELTQMGTPTTGDRKMDAMMASERAHTLRTIPELTKLHSMGCEIILVNPRKDAPRIYDLVQAFLAEWAEELNRGMNIQLETEEFNDKMSRILADIEALEQFSLSMYPIAKKVMPNALKSSTLAAKLSELTKFKGRIRATNASSSTPVLPKDAPSPFTDSLTNLGRDRVRRWVNKDTE